MVSPPPPSRVPPLVPSALPQLPPPSGPQRSAPRVTGAGPGVGSSNGAAVGTPGLQALCAPSPGASPAPSLSASVTLALAGAPTPPLDAPSLALAQAQAARGKNNDAFSGDRDTEHKNDGTIGLRASVSASAGATVGAADSSLDPALLRPQPSAFITQPQMQSAAMQQASPSAVVHSARYRHRESALRLWMSPCARGPSGAATVNVAATAAVVELNAAQELVVPVPAALAATASASAGAGEVPSLELRVPMAASTAAQESAAAVRAGAAAGLNVHERVCALWWLEHTATAVATASVAAPMSPVGVVTVASPGAASPPRAFSVAGPAAAPRTGSPGPRSEANALGATRRQLFPSATLGAGQAPVSSLRARSSRGTGSNQNSLTDADADAEEDAVASETGSAAPRPAAPAPSLAPSFVQSVASTTTEQLPAPAPSPALTAMSHTSAAALPAAPAPSVASSTASPFGGPAPSLVSVATNAPPPSLAGSVAGAAAGRGSPVASPLRPRRPSHRRSSTASPSIADATADAALAAPAAASLRFALVRAVGTDSVSMLPAPSAIALTAPATAPARLLLLGSDASEAPAPASAAAVASGAAPAAGARAIGSVPSLQWVLSQPRPRAALLRFLASRHCAESAAFLDAARAFWEAATALALADWAHDAAQSIGVAAPAVIVVSPAAAAATTAAEAVDLKTDGESAPPTPRVRAPSVSLAATSSWRATAARALDALVSLSVVYPAGVAPAPIDLPADTKETAHSDAMAAADTAAAVRLLLPPVADAPRLATVQNPGLPALSTGEVPRSALTTMPCPPPAPAATLVEHGHRVRRWVDNAAVAAENAADSSRPFSLPAPPAPPVGWLPPTAGAAPTPLMAGVEVPIPGAGGAVLRVTAPLLMRHLRSAPALALLAAPRRAREPSSTASAVAWAAVDAAAKRVCAEFVRQGASRQVNIDAPTRVAAERAVDAAGVAAPWVFHEPAAAIVRLVERDVFSRFIASQAMADALAPAPTLAPALVSSIVPASNRSVAASPARSTAASSSSSFNRPSISVSTPSSASARALAARSSSGAEEPCPLCAPLYHLNLPAANATVTALAGAALSAVARIGVEEDDGGSDYEPTPKASASPRGALPQCLHTERVALCSTAPPDRVAKELQLLARRFGRRHVANAAAVTVPALSFAGPPNAAAGLRALVDAAGSTAVTAAPSSSAKTKSVPSLLSADAGMLHTTGWLAGEPAPGALTAGATCTGAVDRLLAVELCGARALPSASLPLNLTWPVGTPGDVTATVTATVSARVCVDGRAFLSPPTPLTTPGSRTVPVTPLSAPQRAGAILLADSTASAATVSLPTWRELNSLAGCCSASPVGAGEAGTHNAGPHAHPLFPLAPTTQALRVELMLHSSRCVFGDESRAQVWNTKASSRTGAAHAYDLLREPAADASIGVSALPLSALATPYRPAWYPVWRALPGGSWEPVAEVELCVAVLLPGLPDPRLPVSLGQFIQSHSQRRTGAAAAVLSNHAFSASSSSLLDSSHTSAAVSPANNGGEMPAFLRRSTVATPTPSSPAPAPAVQSPAPQGRVAAAAAALETPSPAIARSISAPALALPHSVRTRVVGLLAPARAVTAGGIGAFMRSRLRSLLGSKASAARRRYRDDGFDLDLAYVTPRLALVAEPMEGTVAAGSSRNGLDELTALLNLRHPARALVFRVDAPPHLQGNSSRPGLPVSVWNTVYEGRSTSISVARARDGGGVPTLGDLLGACARMRDWFAQHPQNAVFLQSRKGVARAGVLAALYLISSGAVPLLPRGTAPGDVLSHAQCAAGARAAVQAAMAIVLSKRTTDGESPFLPSQVRYLEYAAYWLLCAAKPLAAAAAMAAVGDASAISFVEPTDAPTMCPCAGSANCECESVVRTLDLARPAPILLLKRIRFSGIPADTVSSKARTYDAEAPATSSVSTSTSSRLKQILGGSRTPLPRWEPRTLSQSFNIGDVTAPRPIMAPAAASQVGSVLGTPARSSVLTPATQVRSYAADRPPTSPLATLTPASTVGAHSQAGSPDVTNSTIVALPTAVAVAVDVHHGRLRKMHYATEGSLASVAAKSPQLMVALSSPRATCSARQSISPQVLSLPRGSLSPARGDVSASSSGSQSPSLAGRSDRGRTLSQLSHSPGGFMPPLSLSRSTADAPTPVVAPVPHSRSGALNVQSVASSLAPISETSPLNTHSQSWRPAAAAAIATAEEEDGASDLASPVPSSALAQSPDGSVPASVPTPCVTPPLDEALAAAASFSDSDASFYSDSGSAAGSSFSDAAGGPVAPPPSLAPGMAGPPAVPARRPPPVAFSVRAHDVDATGPAPEPSFDTRRWHAGCPDVRVRVSDEAAAPGAARTVAVEYDLGGGLPVAGDFAFDLIDPERGSSGVRVATMWANTRFLALKAAAATAAAGAGAEESLVYFEVPRNALDVAPRLLQKLKRRLLSDSFRVEIEATLLLQ